MKIESLKSFDEVPQREISERITASIHKLETGVQLAATSLKEDEEIPDLTGEDNGLYQRLARLATQIDHEVIDDDKLTGEILTGGRKGLRKKFYSGWKLMIKQGSPLQMTATLGHELAHNFTPDIHDQESQSVSETIAEGSIFVVTDYFGFDMSPQAFPYIAGYNNGSFTPDMKVQIKNISAWIISNIS